MGITDVKFPPETVTLQGTEIALRGLPPPAVSRLLTRYSEQLITAFDQMRTESGSEEQPAPTLEDFIPNVDTDGNVVNVPLGQVRAQAPESGGHLLIEKAVSVLTNIDGLLAEFVCAGAGEYDEAAIAHVRDTWPVGAQVDVAMHVFRLTFESEGRDTLKKALGTLWRMLTTQGAPDAPPTTYFTNGAEASPPR